jgi:DNA (cytosine-5)-methyltransferase 1
VLKVRTLFSGIGSPEIALRDLKIPFELVDFCEVDKYAVKSYCAVHGVDPSKNLGDITKVWGRDLPYADLLVWGFPCTDISVAGKQKGIVEGETRSGLYYEGLRILKETKPKYSIIENVKNLTGKKFKAEFEQMLEDIGNLGYNNYYKVLNAKDYGIPQNRERVFIVSIRKDVDKGNFEFPLGFDNGLRLKDFLESEVEGKYYISHDKTEKLIHSLKEQSITNSTCIPCLTPDRIEKRQKGRRFKEDGEPMFSLTTQDRHGILQVGSFSKEDINDNERQRRVYSEYGISPTILARTDNAKILQVGMLDMKASQQVRRVYNVDGLSPTLDTMQGGHRQPKILTDYRIRKLTPKECWRLMGFSDEDFQRAVDAGVSNSQLYKQAGNSIVSNVLFYIFKNLLVNKNKEGV